MDGLYIVRSDGHVVLSRHYAQSILDERVLATFAATVPNISRTMFGTQIRHIAAIGAMVHVMLVGDYVFIAHTKENFATLLAENLLNEFISMMKLLYGPSEGWKLSIFPMDGLYNFIDYFCQNGIKNPCISLKGIPQTQLPKDAKFRLDSLFVQFESSQGICSNSSMLVAGENLIYSRLEVDLTRQLFNFHFSYPMGHTSFSWIPVFVNGSWFNLVRARIGSQILLALCHSTKSLYHSIAENDIHESYNIANNNGSTTTSPNTLSMIDENINSELPNMMDLSSDTQPMISLALLLARIGEFQFGFSGARLDIAREPGPPLLRELAPRDTLLLLCMHVTTGLVVFPTLRPQPDSLRKAMLEVFWELFGAAQGLIETGAVKQVALSREAYHFVCACEGDFLLYAMYAVESVTCDQACVVTNDMLDAFRISINADQI